MVLSNKEGQNYSFWAFFKKRNSFCTYDLAQYQSCPTHIPPSIPNTNRTQLHIPVNRSGYTRTPWQQWFLPRGVRWCSWRRLPRDPASPPPLPPPLSQFPPHPPSPSSHPLISPSRDRRRCRQQPALPRPIPARARLPSSPAPTPTRRTAPRRGAGPPTPRPCIAVDEQATRQRPRAAASG